MIRFTLLALLAAGCPRGETDTQDTAPPLDLVGPVITHTPVTGPVEAGTPIDLTATIVDEADGVLRAVAFFRRIGSPVYEPLVLERGDGDVWTGQIPGTRVEAPGIEYYLHAEDGSDFRVATLFPEDGEDAPIQVEVPLVGADLPFTEDFEGGADALTLFGIGWTEVSTGFAGSPWTLTSTRANGGAWSVVHRQGAEGLPEFVDWLVTPPLRIEGDGPYAVSWTETGDFTDRADHALFYSLGSPDPRDGDFVEIQRLDPPPEDGWGRSRVVELPPEARGAAVYLAWQYVGQQADTWYLDDVTVGDLGPDVLLIDVDTTRVDPGGTATVTLTLENGTRIDAPGLTVSGRVDPALGAFQDTQTLDLAGDASASVDLLLDVAPTHPDNARLPFVLEATDGTTTWTWQRDLLVGDPSWARLDLSTFQDGLVQVVLGAGDPDAPSTRIPVVSDVLPMGTHQYVVDLTDAVDLLPPAPGDRRWWVEITSPDTVQLDGFAIDHDGTTYQGTDLGIHVPTGTPTRFFLPEPPRPALGPTSTVPAPLAPGDVATWTLQLDNLGAATSGDTTVTVTSHDPNVQVLTTGPVLFAPGGWPAGASTLVDVDVQVLDTKRDARPAAFTVTVADEVEAWDLAASLEVPWPVVVVQGVAVDDFSDGDDDGLLDPGERVFLDITLANVGTRDTFGSVSCTLVPDGGSATATLLDATGAFRRLVAGANDNEDDFEIAVTGGDPGDDLRFRLACDDGTIDYEASLALVLGERPWLGIAPANDPTGDVLGGYDFDLVNGSYRVQDDMLQIRLVSATPYDPTTAFVEMWFSSPGAEYSFYQAVAQSGNGSLRGYGFGFTPLDPDPVVTDVDPHTLRIDLPLAPMGLAVDRIEIGFASGFCGPPTTFCDHFPDGWGDPFNAGLDPTRWFPLSW